VVKYYLTGKIRKKERIEKKKGWFGKEIVEIPVYDAEITSKKDTLYGEVKEFIEILKERGVKPDKNALEEIFEHTHLGIYITKKEGGFGTAYAPSRKDAIKYSILFQLLGLPLAHEMEEDKARQASRKSDKIVSVAIGDEKTEKKWVWHPELEKTWDDSRVLPPFDELKKAAPTIALILETEYDHLPESKRKKMDRFVKAAIALTERLAEIKARGEKATKHIKAGDVPEFEEFVNALKAVAPDKMLIKTKRRAQTKKPKYPATKKEVEEKLKKAEIPEEKVKIVAPRLATAVWLDKWFENSLNSYTYKKLGGVPLDEIKNLRNMILAKKHVAEVAAKVMEEHWTRNNHVKIGEEHVDPKFLPLVREHTPETFEDLENIRKAVKEGKMSVEEAILRLHSELFVLHTALKFVGELTGAPDCLAPNPRPLGASDRYVVTLNAVEKIQEKLRGTLGIYL